MFFIPQTVLSQNWHQLETHFRKHTYPCTSLTYFFKNIRLIWHLTNNIIYQKLNDIKKNSMSYRLLWNRCQVESRIFYCFFVVICGGETTKHHAAEWGRNGVSTRSKQSSPLVHTIHCAYSSVYLRFDIL